MIKSQILNKGARFSGLDPHILLNVVCLQGACTTLQKCYADKQRVQEHEGTLFRSRSIN